MLLVFLNFSLLWDRVLVNPVECATLLPSRNK